MSRYRKIVWNEGMLLAPHHFQQWDNYYEELLASRLASIAPYEWGLLDFQANSEAVANGNVDLLRCRGVMPDGLWLNIPETDPHPRPGRSKDTFQRAASELEFTSPFLPSVPERSTFSETAARRTKWSATGRGPASCLTRQPARTSSNWLLLYVI